MREILDLCIEIDTFAMQTYDELAAVCRDEDIAAVMLHMSTEEQLHVRWWQELLTAWEQGLVPDLVNDTESLTWQMRSILTELKASVPSDVAVMDGDEVLVTAVRIEFYLIDPIFAQLLDLTEPGRSEQQREQYELHIDRLIEAIERHYGEKTLTGFLARVLRRSWRDNITLARSPSHDSLTGLYNRQGILTLLHHWTSWAGRYGRPLAVMLVDLDDFRRVNDDNGHAIGDAALQAVAEALVSCVRSSDTVARYGGDEFAIVAPETDAARCANVAERIVETIRGVRLSDWDGTPIRITASVGAAMIGPDVAVNARTTDDMLAAADRRLYSAKLAGKDRAGGCANFWKDGTDE